MDPQQPYASWPPVHLLQSLLAAACTHIKGFVHVQTRCSDHILPRNTCSCAGLTKPLSRSLSFPDHAVVLPSLPPPLRTGEKH